MNKDQNDNFVFSTANEFKNSPIKDKRIVRRLIKTVESLIASPGESIPKACQSQAQTKAAYRLLSNKKLKSDDILVGHRQETIKRISENGTVLSLQDTSLLDYTTHPGTKGLGPTGKEGLKGILMHTALAVSTSGTPLGILAQSIWTRNPNEPPSRNHRKKRPIEEKESYKWLDTMDKSLADIPESTTVVTVGDREADIYELFHKAVKEKKHVLIRAIYNRNVEQEQKKLYEQVKSTPVLGEFSITVPRKTELNSPPREAWLTVQSCRVTLCPSYVKGKSLEKIVLTAILVRENAPPKGVKPIEWLLLTTLMVHNAKEAIEKVHWYSYRWKIERFHYVLKSGCKIEELQLETFERLKNAISIYSFLAWRLTWITYQARETPNIPCDIVFSDTEWKILYCRVKETSRIPKKVPSLKEAVLLVAKLGGFLARKGDGDPGVVVLWRGLRDLYTITKALPYLSF